MKLLEDLKEVLTVTLGLEQGGAFLTAETALLGNLPELDSIAVVNLIASIEDRFDIEVADEEINADTFETLGSLAAFVQNKITA